MALPYMAPRLTARKNIYEQVIVSRRNKQEDYRQNWNHTSNFFKNADVRSSQLSLWSSEKSYNHSMDAYQKMINKEERAANLARRRQKLAKLYEDERRQNQVELSGFSSENQRRLLDMKDRADGLRSAREEKRKQVASEKLFDHWRLNNPDLREIEREQHKDHVVNAWKDQVNENKQILETARKEKEDFEHRAELERLNSVRQQEEQERAKIKAEKDLKESLQKQMEELKLREEEGKRLKKEEDTLIAQQTEVDRLEQLQTQREEESKKQQFGRLLLKQHVAQMKRKSQLVQQEVEQDIELLRRLLEQEKDDTELQLARKEQAKADAAWMKQVLDEQMKLEKAREAEMEMIYQHEAARMWEKRESEWTKERAARQRLMKEVLESRQQQIETRLAEIQREREESLEQRQKLIHEMDVANKMANREQEEQTEVQMAQQQALRHQIEAQKEAEQQEKLKLKLDLDEEEREEADQRDLLRQETERMKQEGYTQRDVGRRRQAWF